VLVVGVHFLVKNCHEVMLGGALDWDLGFDGQANEWCAKSQLQTGQSKLTIE